MTQRPGIYLDNVSITYGYSTVIENLTGVFPKGSMTAIIGPNGGGKTTLFRVLMSMISPCKGRLQFEGLESTSVAYLAQSQELERYFPLNVFDIVAMGHFAQQGITSSLSPSLQEEVEEALEAVKLASLSKALLSELSGGQIQRVFFARLSLQKASLILLDEPFAAVDPYTLDELLDCLYRWQREGATILMISHDLDIVRNHFPYCLLLAREAIAWGETHHVLTPDNIRQAKSFSRCFKV